MTRPLNDDGTIPKRRYLRLALQFVEGSRVLAEVHREVKPRWTPVDPNEAIVGYDSSTEPAMTPEQQVEPVARALSEGASPTVLEMARELLLGALTRLKK